MRRALVVLAGLLVAVPGLMAADGGKAPARKKIVLLAGPKSHGPVGNGIHDYGWSVRLLRVLLENSNIKDRVRVEHHLDGWPRDPRTLEDADTLLVISDGRDGDLYQEAPHLASPERVRYLDGLMKKGCGFGVIHFSTFAPNRHADEVLRWSGGFFQWETDGKRQWYSAIQTKEAAVELPTPGHPVCRGVRPFRLREEFYHNLRFRPGDKGLAPLLAVADLKGREPDGNVVAWARQREDGGRGFGTTCGHFYDNWGSDDFRTLVLNALAWTAKVEVPEGGVRAAMVSRQEIDQRLGPYPGQAVAPAPKAEPPLRVLLLAGNEAHKWHNWEKTTPAIRAALERDPRVKVDVTTEIEDLARKDLGQYGAIVQNYCNWHDPKGLSEAGKAALVKYLAGGGGLVVVHFANGAFHRSLPMAGASDWPEYRRIVRRVWDHDGKDGPKGAHDAFGRFAVRMTTVSHPVTAGLRGFEVEDELYYDQAGAEPVEPLITARSRNSGRDEPLAWAYPYGKGRVFQTLLGHSEKTYAAFEAREVLRRAVAWAAGREVRPLDPAREGAAAAGPDKPAQPLVAGKFGQALDARVVAAVAAGRNEYRTPPITVDLWARLLARPGFHILVASDTKASAAHWEVFTQDGKVMVYTPGRDPDHVRTSVDIADGRWHHVAMVYEPGRIRVYVDGRLAADGAGKARGGTTVPGDLVVGELVEGGIDCFGQIDEARLRKGAHEPKGVPEAAPAADADTLGLWSFDRAEGGKVADGSKAGNAAVLRTPPPGAAGPLAEPDGQAYTALDPALWISRAGRW